MKKFFLLIIFLFLVFCTYFSNKQDIFFSYFNKYSDAEFCYVFNQDLDVSSSRQVFTMGCKFVYFKECLVSNYSPLYRQVVIYNCDIDDILLDLNISTVKIDQISGVYVLYGYSPNFSQNVVLGANKVNFQISISQTCITIGYPMIFGAF